LLDSHRAGFDQVVARRTRAGDPKARSWFAWFYYRAVRRLADVEIIDGVGDFRLLSRRAVDAILSLDETNRFSKGLFAWIGFDTAVVEYDNVPRAGSRSRWSAGRLINYGVQGIVSFNDRPLRAAIYLGSVVTGLAGLYVAYIIVQTVASGVRTPGYVTLITVMVVMSGLQLLFLGIMGEYVGKIYFEAKRRPHYLVKETEEMMSPSVPGVRRTPSHR
jgi:polyisoprenyl-phosphate glycosyltransferase